MGGGPQDASGEAAPREGRWTRVVGVVVGLTAVIGLPLAAFDLYDRVSSLQDTVDHQAEQLELQRQALSVQKAQLDQQERHFLVAGNGTAVEDARLLVQYRLSLLKAAIQEAAASPTLSAAGGVDRVQDARALQAQAEKAFVDAWGKQAEKEYAAAFAGYQAAQEAIDDAHEALERPDGATPGSTAADLNQALAASLLVTRDGSNNTLLWSDVMGEEGYQVWSRPSASSQYVALATLAEGTTTYADLGAPVDTSYLVTAVVDGRLLTADDISSGDVPGYSGVPGGEAVGEFSGGYVPGPALPLAAGALALAALVARRRPR